MSWDAAPTGRRVRPRTDNGTAIQAGLTTKVLLAMVDNGAPLVRATMSIYQTTCLVESLLRLVGLDWKLPDISTLSRRQ